MKYILISIILGCMAQYPNTRYTGNDLKYIQRKDATSYARSKAINIGVWPTKGGKYRFEFPYQQFDSAKYYSQKQTYWEKKYKKESKRLDKLKTPELSQELLDYQDSAIRYKLLLEKTKYVK